MFTLGSIKWIKIYLELQMGANAYSNKIWFGWRNFGQIVSVKIRSTGFGQTSVDWIRSDWTGDFSANKIRSSWHEHSGLQLSKLQHCLELTDSIWNEIKKCFSTLKFTSLQLRKSLSRNGRFNVQFYETFLMKKIIYFNLLVSAFVFECDVWVRLFRF